MQDSGYNLSQRTFPSSSSKGSSIKSANRSTGYSALQDLQRKYTRRHDFFKSKGRLQAKQ